MGTYAKFRDRSPLPRRLFESALCHASSCQWCVAGQPYREIATEQSSCVIGLPTFWRRPGCSRACPRGCPIAALYPGGVPDPKICAQGALFGTGVGPEVVISQLPYISPGGGTWKFSRSAKRSVGRCWPLPWAGCLLRLYLTRASPGGHSSLRGLRWGLRPYEPMVPYTRW